MTIGELLADAFGRIRGSVHRATAGLDVDGLTYRPDAQANSIAWLVWHLTRIQDDHLADAFGTEQAWLAGGWADRFALPFDRFVTGYGHASRDVAQVVVGRELLVGYHDAVHDVSVALVSGVSATDLERIVDESWDPPVSLGVRLVSVINDDMEHAGQAEYVRGLLERR